MVDLILFTDGAEVGRHIMKTASGNFKKIWMGLGGKNPNIVFEDADFDMVVSMLDKFVQPEPI